MMTKNAMQQKALVKKVAAEKTQIGAATISKMAATISKMAAGDNVTMDVIEKVCRALDVKVEGIWEFVD